VPSFAVYATVAARSVRAERAMLPVLDVLQSIPVLGCLTGLPPNDEHAAS
jgi:ABC-type anion transport system duplicated permease subunit